MKRKCVQPDGFLTRVPACPMAPHLLLRPDYCQSQPEQLSSSSSTVKYLRVLLEDARGNQKI